MNTRLQLRRWLHTASLTERITTACVAALALALLGAALVPAPALRGRGADGRRDIVTARGEAQSEQAATGTTTTSIVGPSGASARGAQPSPTTSPLGATTSPTVRFPAGEPITVGFSHVDASRAQNAFGYYPDLRTDAADAIRAYVDYANRHGGAAGRPIEARIVKADFTAVADQATKCIQLTETFDVFAVIDSFAFTDPRASQCITVQHNTLLVNAEPHGSDEVRAQAPNHVSPWKDGNRVMKDLVFGAKGSGFFDPSKGFRRLAVLDTTCNESTLDSPDDGLFKYLRDAGVAWTEFRMECVPARSAENARRAIQQMRQDNVSHVLLVLNHPNLKTYLDEAANEEFSAAYFASDWAYAVVGGLAPQFNPTAFDGALAVTQSRAGERLSPLAAKCSAILIDHGLAPIDPMDRFGISDDVEVLELCEHLFLFIDVANRAGPHFTRGKWIDALPGGPDFRGAVVDLARFSPRGKLTGGDTMKIVQWRKACRCWAHLTDFGPAAG